MDQKIQGKKQGTIRLQRRQKVAVGKGVYGRRPSQSCPGDENTQFERRKTYRLWRQIYLHQIQNIPADKYYYQTFPTSRFHFPYSQLLSKKVQPPI